MRLDEYGSMDLISRNTRLYDARCVSQVPERLACAGTFAKAEAAAGKVQQGGDVVTAIILGIISY